MPRPRNVDDPVGIRLDREGSRQSVAGFAQVLVGDDKPRTCLVDHPADLVLTQRQRHGHDHRAEVGDRELQRHVLPYVGQTHTNHVAVTNATGGKQALDTPDLVQQLLEGDLVAAFPDGGAGAPASRIRLEIADRSVWLRRH